MRYGTELETYVSIAEMMMGFLVVYGLADLQTCIRKRDKAEVPILIGRDRCNSVKERCADIRDPKKATSFFRRIENPPFLLSETVGNK